MLWLAMASFTAIILIIILSFCTTCVSTTFHAHSVPFLPQVRGGSSNTDYDDTTIAINNDHLVGIIDIRPSPNQDGMILLRENCGGDAYDLLQEARFNGDDEHATIDDEMSEQGAISQSIGSLCNRVYLVISYDFEKGVTSLHKSLGGCKLLSFVDGARSRWQDKQSESVATKLVLLLVPSSPTSEAVLSASITTENILHSSINQNKIVIDLTKNIDWGDNGAKHLVTKLVEAFALGGDEYQSIDPFSVEMIGILDNRQEKNDEDTDIESGTDISEVVLKHLVCSGFDIIQTNDLDEASTSAFQELITSAYTSIGGKRSIDFE